MCTGNPFSDDYVVNQNFHHLAGQMLYVGVALNQFLTLVTSQNLRLQLVQPLVRLLDLLFYALTVCRKAIRHRDVILLADDALDLIHIQGAQVSTVVLKLFLEFGLGFQPIYFLLFQVLAELDIALQFILIQLGAGEGVQLLNHHFLQFLHGNEGPDAGVLRHMTVGALQIVPPAIFG